MRVLVSVRVHTGREGRGYEQSHHKAVCLSSGGKQHTPVPEWALLPRRKPEGILYTWLEDPLIPDLRGPQHLFAEEEPTLKLKFQRKWGAPGTSLYKVS